VPGGPDPTLSIPTDLLAGSGNVVIVPVNLDTAMPTGSLGLTEANLALIYDSNVFSVASSDINLGTLPSSGSGWTLTSTINPVTGQIGINLYSTTPLTTTEGGSLVTIAFHLKAAAPSGVTPIQLVAAVNPSGSQVIRTELADPEEVLTLHPLPEAVSAIAPDGDVSAAANEPASTPAITASLFPSSEGADALAGPAASPPAPLGQFFQALPPIEANEISAESAEMRSAKANWNTALFNIPNIQPAAVVSDPFKPPSSDLVIEPEEGSIFSLRFLDQAALASWIEGARLPAESDPLPADAFPRDDYFILEAASDQN
jgi:hypothetical protein